MTSTVVVKFIRFVWFNSNLFGSLVRWDDGGSATRAIDVDDVDVIKKDVQGENIDDTDDCVNGVKNDANGLNAVDDADDSDDMDDFNI